MSKEISGKSVGKNVILIINDEKYSKAFTTKEERQAVLAKVEEYNKKNSAAKLKDLVMVMKQDVVEREEKVQEVKERKAKKASPKLIPEVKPAEADVIVPAQTVEQAIMYLLEKGYSVQKTQKEPVKSTPKRGEW